MNSDTLKYFSIMIVLNVLIVFGVNIAVQIVLMIFHWYLGLELILAHLFHPGNTGYSIMRCLTLAVFPFLIAGIPALIYWAVKRKLMPYFYPVVWFFWLLIILCILIK